MNKTNRFDEDQPFLLRKFREPVLDPSTGMTNEEIRQALAARVSDWDDLPRPVGKARVFEFICDNMAIAIGPHDLFPTFLEAAGVTPPEVPDNRSILPQVLGRDEPTGRDSVYGAFYAHLFPAPLRFVRTKRHKLVFNQVDMGELYDVVDDPWELHNRFNDPAMAEVKAQLMERLREHMETLEDPILPSFDRIRHVY